MAAVGGALITAVAPVVLRALNAQYGAMGATAVIAVLCAGTLLRIAYLVWAAVQRWRRQMTMLLTLNFLSASVLVATMPGLCHQHGALGGALAVLVGQAVLTAGAAIHFVVIGRRSKVPA